MKKIRLLSLLLVTTLFMQNADAQLLLLPDSSHYQGRSYFDESGRTGFVDFAVYDTMGPSGNEWESSGFASPGDGQFIYAYQIFCDPNSSNAVEVFTIMGFDDPPVSHVLNGIDTMDAQDPWEDFSLIVEGVAPTGTYINPSQTRATWKFDGGILFADQYSWFLIFSSTEDWVKGKYMVVRAEDDFPIPANNPEPCTLALLGLGGAILLAKRREYVRSYRTRSHN